MAHFRVLVLCLILISITWIGCGGNVTSANNTPTVTTPATTTPPASPPPATPSSAATFVYVANNGSTQQVGGSISGFSMDAATGALKPLAGAPFAAGDGPSAIAADPQGRLVFVAGDGSVTGARGSNCTLVHSTILSETVDRSSGALTRSDNKTLDGVCARAVTVDPASKDVYIATTRFGASDGEIEGFAIGAGGSLTPLPGSPLLVNGTATGLAMHPSGKFIYAATDSGVLVVDRDPLSGALLQAGDFNTAKHKLALNPAGTFLAASELNSNEVSEFHVDPTTGNIAATDIRAQAQNPLGVAADPMGKFFAVTEETDTTTFAGGVSMFLLNDATHELDKISGSPFSSGLGTVDVAFDPSGAYVYAVNRQDVTASGHGTVSGFVVDRASGMLQPVPGTHFATGDFPASLAVVQPK